MRRFCTPASPAAGGRTERLRLPDAPPDLLPDGRGCPFKARCPIKLGPVCDKEPPPVVAAGRERVIYCHHPLDVLERLESVVPGAPAPEDPGMDRAAPVAAGPPAGTG